VSPRAGILLQLLSDPFHIHWKCLWPSPGCLPHALVRGLAYQIKCVNILLSLKLPLIRLIGLITIEGSNGKLQLLCVLAFSMVRFFPASHAFNLYLCIHIATHLFPQRLAFNARQLPVEGPEDRSFQVTRLLEYIVWYPSAYYFSNLRL